MMPGREREKQGFDRLSRSGSKATPKGSRPACHFRPAQAELVEALICCAGERA